jgi:hypothetical protein
MRTIPKQLKKKQKNKKKPPKWEARTRSKKLRFEATIVRTAK